MPNPPGSTRERNILAVHASYHGRSTQGRSPGLSSSHNTPKAASIISSPQRRTDTAEDATEAAELVSTGCRPPGRRMTDKWTPRLRGARCGRRLSDGQSTPSPSSSRSYSPLTTAPPSLRHSPLSLLLAVRCLLLGVCSPRLLLSRKLAALILSARLFPPPTSTLQRNARAQTFRSVELTLRQQCGVHVSLAICLD